MEWLLLRMAQWVRRRPSRQWITVAIVVVIVAAVLVTVENTVGWPDWLTANPASRRGVPINLP